MVTPNLLTFNAGSSSVKIGLFSVNQGVSTQIGAGAIDLRHEPLVLKLKNAGQSFEIALQEKLSEDLHEVIDETLTWLDKHFSLDHLNVVGHRVVHGGDQYAGPVAVDQQVLDILATFIPLAPLHQPHSLRLIQAIRHLRPDLLQTASFDTAFHRSQSDCVRTFAIPHKWFEEGIKRYGFHGLSYQYVMRALGSHFPEYSQRKTVVAHLGSGASLCAIESGLSRDTSMGFSTLDGIPMATRCGALDPGVILYFLEHVGISASEIEHLLYEKSGLLGMSGVSAEMRDLLKSAQDSAKKAIEHFTFRIAGEIARLANTLGGLETLIFTAGIGEHQPEIRAAVCQQLAWLGVGIDSEVNASAQGEFKVLSQPASRVTVLVVPTNEEQIIADEAQAIRAQLG